MRNTASKESGIFFCNERQPEIQAKCAINASREESGKGCTGEIFSYPIASLEPEFRLFNYRDCLYEEQMKMALPNLVKQSNKYSFLIPYFNINDGKAWFIGIFEALSSLRVITRIFFYEIIVRKNHVRIQFVARAIDAALIRHTMQSKFPNCAFILEKEDYLAECITSLKDKNKFAIEILYPHAPYFRNLIAPASKNASTINQLLESAKILDDDEFFYVRTAIEISKGQWEKNCINLHNYESRILSVFADANLFPDYMLSPYSESNKSISEKLNPEYAPMFFVQPLFVMFGDAKKFQILKSFLTQFRFGDFPYQSVNTEQIVSKLTKEGVVDSLLNRTIHAHGHLLNRLEAASFLPFPCEQSVSLSNGRLFTTAGLPVPEEFQTDGLHLGNCDQIGKSISVCIPNKILQHSLGIIGAMGFGKSTLLLRLLEQISSNPDYSIILFYFQEFQFVADFISCIPDNRLDDVILAMPVMDGKVLKNNIVDGAGVGDISKHTTDLVYAIEAATTTLGINIKLNMKTLFQILHLNRNASLADIFEVIDKESIEGKAMRRQAKDKTRNRLLRKKIDALEKFGEEESPIENKLQFFFDVEDAAMMANYSGRNAISYKDIVSRKKILIWYLGNLGIAGDMIASMEVALLHQAFSGFSKEKIKPYYPTIAVIDEAQRIKAQGVDDSVHEDRKFGLSYILSTQGLSGLDSSLLEAIKLIRSLVFFQTSEEDAKFFCQSTAGRFSPKEIAMLDKYEMAVRLLSAKNVFCCKSLPFVPGDYSKVDYVKKNSLEKYYADPVNISDEKTENENHKKHTGRQQILSNLPESIKKIAQK